MYEYGGFSGRLKPELVFFPFAAVLEFSVAACGFSMAGCRTPDAGLDLRGGGGSSCCWGVSVVMSALTYDWRREKRGREKRRAVRCFKREKCRYPAVGVLASERYTASGPQNPSAKWSEISLQLRTTLPLRTVLPWRMKNARRVRTDIERKRKKEWGELVIHWRLIVQDFSSSQGLQWVSQKR